MTRSVVSDSRLEMASGPSDPEMRDLFAGVLGVMPSYCTLRYSLRYVTLVQVCIAIACGHLSEHRIAAPTNKSHSLMDRREDSIDGQDPEVDQENEKKSKSRRPASNTR